MRLMSSVRIWCALVGLMAHTAWAGAAADVRSGQELFLNSLLVEIEGQTYSTLGYTIPKKAGELDLDIRLSDFGLHDDQPIHATAAVSGPLIIWTFDKTFDPPVGINGTYSLEHASGRVVAKAQLASGFDPVKCRSNPCSRNVRLSLDSGSSVLIEGSGPLGAGWSRVVNLKELRALGGIAQPKLTGLGAPDKLYSRKSSQNLTLSVSLDSLAPSGGTQVDFISSAPRFLQLPPHVVIPEGKSIATVTATLRPDFTGSITVKAASNSAVMERTLEVLPESDSEGKKTPWGKSAYVPDSLAGCGWCTDYIDFTGSRRGLAAVSGRPAYFTPTQLVELTDHFRASSVSPVALAETGWMTGTLLTPSGATQAFKAHFGALNDQAVLLGSNFSPVAINAYGMVLGNRQAGSGMLAATHDGQELKDLPLGATWSRAIAMSEAGHVVGVMETSSRKGFSYFAGRTQALPALSEGATTVPAAVNRSGAIAGSSEGPDGTRAAIRADASGNVQQLGELPGYRQSWATSINDLGWIVGTASDGKSSVGFLWTPRDGLIGLNQLAGPQEDMVITEALKVTNGKQIVVKGQVDGKQELYVLSL